MPFLAVTAIAAACSECQRLLTNALLLLQIQKCYLLKYITRLEAFQSSVDAATPAYIELHLSNTTFTSETRKAFQVPGPLLVDIIGSIYLFCK